MSQQSQAKFADIIAGWGREECLKNLDSALPKALANLEDSAYIADSIKMLKLICQLFLPCVPTEELEDRLFAHMCHVASELMDSSLNKIQLNMKGALKNTAEEVREVLMECVQWLIDIGQCIETCVRHMVDVSPVLELDHVRSLLTCTIHVLKKSYTHCKESTDLYGDLLEHLSESLTAVFKQAHSLQMAYLSALDKLHRSGPPLEDHVQLLTSVCLGLFDVCSVVSSLDVKLAIGLWRAISRVCSQQLNLLRDRLDVCPMICFLCGEIRSGYDYLFQLCHPPDPDSLSQGDDKAFSKAVKIVSFQMKVLVALLRDFALYLGSCEEEVLSLLIFLLRCLPPSLTAGQLSEKQESELRVQVVSATSPIIKHLLTSKPFRSALVQNNEGREESDHLPVLLLQLMVLDVLPKAEVEVMDFWLSPVDHNKDQCSVSLLTAVLESAKLCWLEMRVPVMLPGVMVTGKPQRAVCLFEYVACHLCGFIGACLSHHFSHLEETLMGYVLHGDSVTYLLAVDCWCFLVRYGTASVCKEQVVALLSARTRLKQQKGRQAQSLVSRLETLLQRLLKFMSPKDQAALVKEYPPTTHPGLWTHLLSSGLNADVASIVGRQLVSWGLGVLTATRGKVSNVLTALTMFTTLGSTWSPASPQYMSVQQQTDLTEAVLNMWSHLEKIVTSERLSRPPHIARLLELTASVVSSLDTDAVIRVLDVSGQFVTKKALPDICLSLTLLLSAVAKTNFRTSAQMTDVLQRVSSFLPRLLHHTHPLVRHRGLNTLADFADSPTTAHVVSECIEGHKELEEMWREFISGAPGNFSGTDSDEVDVLRRLQQHKQMADVISETQDEEIETVGAERDDSQKREGEEVTNSDERSADRGKESSDLISSQNNDAGGPDPVDTSPCPGALDSVPHKPGYQNILEKLQAVAAELEEVHKKSGSRPPTWFVEAANESVTRITLSLSGHDWFDSLT
ncbi:uncharacterized protein C1orf112 homolog [Aplysia californica]|uniref:Uncharacterized protein C1orf112 homolog n=1 Tax=Aplysia californica TaxID=6500 RepID=A0ABM1VQY7_APLCA|nr:uncharacterized protein C1orf112 homolog [Aplysia californica]XP_035824830.1 uncharacterized protein C1orf112 homolog [Aplysia californica]